MSPEAARRNGIRARHDMTERQLRRASRIICRRIIRSTVYRNAQVVAMYLAMRREVDLTLLMLDALQRNKRICLPVIDDNGGMQFRGIDDALTLRRHRFGMLQPERLHRQQNPVVPRRNIHLICAPLTAFDKHLHRTGSGGGYYDRYLAGAVRRLKPCFLGAAFACQQVENIDAANWDIALDAVVTEQNFFRLR